jgi:hypothetical protein
MWTTVVHYILPLVASNWVGTFAEFGLVFVFPENRSYKNGKYDLHQKPEKE